jgi:3-deoxy-manno-octulosonate cytidylyltransferase (CMP-KDO synthetase)
MGSSRFPGKPLADINGKPMLRHVYDRARPANLDNLIFATCDSEIEEYLDSVNLPYVTTSKSHDRALDRVAECGQKLNLSANDCILCIQGDEPMLNADFIDRVAQPILSGTSEATMLGMEIKDRDVWKDPNTVKIIHNNCSEVLYTSRSPIPYNAYSDLNPALPRRIYGIFGFIFKRLLEFSRAEETYLEHIESCDSNRILDLDFKQTVVLVEYQDSFSVDCPEDLEKVRKLLSNS